MAKKISSLVVLVLSFAAAGGEEHGTEQIAFLSSDDLKQGAAIPSQARFLSSGQPDEAVLEALARQGFTLVVDFRTEDEERGIDEQRIAEQLGMAYINVPISAPDGVNFDNAGTLLEVIEEHDGRVFLHCGSGNRAGAMLALREKLLGAGDEQALAAGKAAGLTRLEETVRERLAEE